MGVGPKAQKISPIQPYAFMRKATDEAGDRRKEWLTPTQMKSETPKTNWCVKSEQGFFSYEEHCAWLCMSCKFDNTYCFFEKELLRVGHLVQACLVHMPI